MDYKKVMRDTWDRYLLYGCNAENEDMTDRWVLRYQALDVRSFPVRIIPERTVSLRNL